MRLGRHHLVKGRSVVVEVAQLEQALALRHELRRVVREGLELVRQTSHAGARQDRVGGVHEQLERGDALLPVHDVPRGDLVALRRLALEDHRAEEVLGRQVRLCQAELGHPLDVLPERIPLLRLLPDVGALEERDDEVLGQAEHLEGGALEGLHHVAYCRSVFARWAKGISLALRLTMSSQAPTPT